MSTHTVLLVSHLKSQVLLSQFVVDLLQVLDVIDGLPQHSRLVHLWGKKKKKLLL